MARANGAGIFGGMLVGRKTNRFAWTALVLSTLALGGCSISVADLPIGPPADASAHPKEADGYLPVHDLPPDREQAVLAPDEQAKIERELIAARDHQVSAAAAGEAVTR